MAGMMTETEKEKPMSDEQHTEAEQSQSVKESPLNKLSKLVNFLQLRGQYLVAPVILLNLIFVSTVCYNCIHTVAKWTSPISDFLAFMPDDISEVEFVDVARSEDAECYGESSNRLHRHVRRLERFGFDLDEWDYVAVGEGSRTLRNIYVMRGDFDPEDVADEIEDRHRNADQDEEDGYLTVTVGRSGIVFHRNYILFATGRGSEDGDDVVELLIELIEGEEDNLESNEDFMELFAQIPRGVDVWGLNTSSQANVYEPRDDPSPGPASTQTSRSVQTRGGVGWSLCSGTEMTSGEAAYFRDRDDAEQATEWAQESVRLSQRRLRDNTEGQNEETTRGQQILLDAVEVHRSGNFMITESQVDLEDIPENLWGRAANNRARK